MKINSCLALCLVVTLGVFPAGYARAEDHVVVQKNKEFSQTDISVKAGDTITFSNEDDVAHNIYSKSDAKSFEIPKQDPGQKETVTFDKAGEVKIQCAIHPKMKMTVKVE